MRFPYGLQIIESCLTCTLRRDNLFCNLSPEALRSMEAIRSTATYPKGTVLFVEGQNPRGVYLLCNGRAKLSSHSSEGKSVILKITEPGEVLGLSATVSGRPYEATLELLEPCQVNFMRRDDFLSFLHQHGDVAVRAAQQLSQHYHSACQEIRTLGFSQSASGRLARLLLEWAESQKNGGNGLRLKMNLTHEEIGQRIGTTRETVTRILADLKRRKILAVKGSSLTITNKAALEELTAS
ncbi:MAG: Crp/Fnr family transcriptional regulator [Terriglobales bacterium]